MTLIKKRLIFIFFWLSLVLFPLYSVYVATVFPITERLILLNFIQRILGLTAFSLLVSQILIGSNMGFFIKHLGGLIYKFHKLEGYSAYFIILFHPLVGYLIRYFSGVKWTGSQALFVLIGQIAFFLLTLSIAAAFFRTKKLMRKIWKKIHLLNYVVFYLISYHSWNLGSDIRLFPFIYVYFIGLFLVTFSLVRKLFHKFASQKGLPPKGK